VSLNCGNEIDEWLKLIVEYGGKITRPKTKIEAEGRGWFALFADTEGNQLGLYGE
jgi:predicted enzyme related to lactoylglutathione lyase